MVVTQHKDGSWSWNRLANHSTHTSTATIYWGLSLAKNAGIPVHHATFENAEKFFAAAFPKIETNDSDTKAIFIHALSVTGRADFSAANRIYRDRQNLSETALGYMAAAFIRMDRPTFAEDLLKILDTKLIDNFRWKSNSRHAILKDDTSTTAVALWSYAKLRRDSATTAKVANYLLGQTVRLRSESSLGPTVAALAEYYNSGQRPADDFKINLIVNDKPVLTINSVELTNTQTFAVPAGQINAGANKVRIKIDGGGEVRYAATLSGFSPRPQRSRQLRLSTCPRVRVLPRQAQLPRRAAKIQQLLSRRLSRDRATLPSHCQYPKHARPRAERLPRLRRALAGWYVTGRRLSGWQFQTIRDRWLYDPCLLRTRPHRQHRLRTGCPYSGNLPHPSWNPSRHLQ